MLFKNDPNERLAFICFAASLLLYIVPINIGGSVIAQSPESLPSSPAARGLPTIQIESHQDGQQVQVGELTIEGISSDNEEKRCRVYADVNDITPMRNVTAAGPNGRNDFSKWTFSYTDEYQLIKEGENELTAKISCFYGNSKNPVTPMSEWYTVNVTGVRTTSGGNTFASSAPSLPPLQGGVPSEDNIEKESADDSAENFQECLFEVEEGERFPTRLEVQDCIESSYSGIESGDNTPSGSADFDDDDENGATEGTSAADIEEEEDEEDSDE
jgi:hypothetical protein